MYLSREIEHAKRQVFLILLNPLYQDIFYLVLRSAVHSSGEKDKEETGAWRAVRSIVLDFLRLIITINSNE